MARTMVVALKRIPATELTRERLVTALASLHAIDFGGFKVNDAANAQQGSGFVELTVMGPDGKLLK